MKLISKLKDPVSGLTHLLGVILSIIGLIALIKIANFKNDNIYIMSSLVFGISLILLYTASSIYHLLNVSKKISNVLRRIDHMMIYILIAGTYTPICLIGINNRFGKGFLIFIWIIAILGIFQKVFWFNAPRIISTCMYIMMGWMSIALFVPLIKCIEINGIMWLVIGGVLYSIGGIVYALKWPLTNAKYFGFHEIFHIFVLLGSWCHFYMIYNYIM
ncbi:hemolysin-III related [Clostridium acetireducens DSM 10703]|jgi:hemolysin III|uniref:Hemolysin-III related n=1 Tax=Clostridium acetireducens DSM 10703 TaxID=1121290 RepID=A0A1E8F105_9CLOT|nr:hemolysin III family protein [Clostridium acetireducens]OFI07012.1 hemolysin-III related [Clostridium acetireducens DSM 10703]